MQKLLEVEKVYDEKYLKMYNAKYLTDCTTCEYAFASRREKQDLTVFNKVDKIDAVKALPYFYEDGKLYVVLINEFRSPLNKHIYSIPAGLVEDNENPDLAIQRELAEEIGAQTVNLERLDNGCYSSAGLSDEKIAHYLAEVILTGRQNLEETEEISIKPVPLEQLLDFVDTHEMCMSSMLLCKMFYYKMKDREE